MNYSWELAVPSVPPRRPVIDRGERAEVVASQAHHINQAWGGGGCGLAERGAS